MSATLNENISNAPTRMTEGTRVSIREVRQASLRALVAIGASHAEANVAADQVVGVEIHQGTGLVSLLAELANGPWSRAGLTCERVTAGRRTALRVAGSDRPGALRQGVLLVDLLAAQSDTDTVVVSEGLTSLSPLLDQPMIQLARTLGCWILAADLSASGVDFRVNSPGGDIGVGAGGTTAVTSPERESLTPGVSLSRLPTAPDAATDWYTFVERQATRAAAAQHGLTVDACVWREVTAAANAFLVPEQ